MVIKKMCNMPAQFSGMKFECLQSFDCEILMKFVVLRLLKTI